MKFILGVAANNNFRVVYGVKINSHSLWSFCELDLVSSNFEEKMAAATSGAPHHAELNDAFTTDKTSIKENEIREGEMDDQSMAKSGKPPRNLPLMRHCISQAMLKGTSVLVSRSQSILDSFCFCYCDIQMIVSGM